MRGEGRWKGVGSGDGIHAELRGRDQNYPASLWLLRTLPTKPCTERPPAFGLCTPVVEITHSSSGVHLRSRGCSCGLSWACLPARSYSVLSLPSHLQVCAPRLMKEGMLGRRFTISLWKSCSVRWSQLPPAAPGAAFPSPWGAGPVCASSVGLSLLADVSPFLSLNPRDVPFHQRSLLGDQGTPLTQAPWGSWSFN